MILINGNNSMMLQHVVRLAVYSSMLSGMSRLRWEQSKQKTLTKYNFVQKNEIGKHKCYSMYFWFGVHFMLLQAIDGNF